MAKNVTMRDIGRALGVSAVSVSKALAGKSGVSEEMRARIEQKAQEMGYRYDLVPKQPRKDRQDVGILVPEGFFDVSASFYGSLCRKVSQKITEIGCFAALEILSDADERACVCPSIVDCGRVDVLIILGQVSRKYIRMLESFSSKVPYVCLDFYDEQSTANSVVSDGMYGSYRLTSHLIHMGHTQIAFLGSILSTSSIMDRYLGYYRSMLQHDLPIHADWLIPDRDDKSIFASFALPNPLPTAIVCNCDLAAYSLIHRLQEQGIRVPEDVSVVGFDDYSEIAGAVPKLTTYAVDQDAMASQVVSLVQDSLAGAITHNGRIVTRGNIIYRDSVRDLTKDVAPEIVEDKIS